MDPMYKGRCYLDEASCWSKMFFNWSKPFMKVSTPCLSLTLAHVLFEAISQRLAKGRPIGQHERKYEREDGLQTSARSIRGE